MSPEVIVFDLDDTLFPERDYVVSGLSAVDWLLRCQYGCSGFKDIALHRFDHGPRDMLINHSIEELGIPVRSGLVRSLVSVYRSHWPTIQLFDDAEVFLRRVKQKHVLALLSDGPLVSQVNKARALQTDQWCAAHVFTDIWGRKYWKPSERGFRHIQNLFPEKKRFVYIADNPVKDFITPRLMGWKTIRMLRHNGLYSNIAMPKSHSADVTVSSFEELSSI